MGIKASNNVFPHDPDDNWKQKLDRGGYMGTAQDIVDKINSIETPDGILVRGNIRKVGDELFIDAGEFTCALDGSIITNFEDYHTTIDAAAEGMYRIDILVFTKYGSILKIRGEESLESAQEPDTPDGTIKISFTSIYGDEIGEPEIPIIEGYYVPVSESQDLIINYGATTILEKIDLIDRRSSISLTGAVTDLKSIQVSAEFVRPGKPFYIKNRTGHDVKLWGFSGTGNNKFSFPNGADLVVKNKEVILFNQNANDLSSLVLEYVGSIPADVSGKEDSSNKKTVIVGNESSDSFYGSIKAWFDFGKATYAKIRKAIIPNATIYYTFKLGDEDGGMVVHSSSSAISEIIPNNATVAFPIGTTIESVSTGTGIKTTSGAAGVTLQSNVSLSSAQYEKRTFTKIDTNTWIVSGNSAFIPTKRKVYYQFLFSSQLAMSSSWYAYPHGTTTGLYNTAITTTTAVDTDDFAGHSSLTLHHLSSMSGYISNVFCSMSPNNSTFYIDIAVQIKRISPLYNKIIAREVKTGSSGTKVYKFAEASMNKTILINELDQIRIFLKNDGVTAGSTNLWDAAITVEVTEA